MHILTIYDILFVWGKNKKVFLDILKNVPKGLNQIEIARWLYLELGKVLSYDMNAFYLKDESLGSKYNKEIDLSKELDTTLVCKPINMIYIKLLKILGINAELIQLDEKFEFNHVGTSITFDNGMKIFTDLTLDLHRIQNGMRTLDFAYTSPNGDYDILSRKELNQIDDKLGYTYRGIYTDDFFEMAAEELTNPIKVERYLLGGRKLEEVKLTEVISKKLDFILNHVMFKRLGYTEGRNLLIHILQKCLSQDEISHVNQYDLIKQNSNDNEFANLIKVFDKADSIYYLQLPDKEMQKCSKDDIDNIFKQGWKNRNKRQILEDGEIEI